MFWELVLIYGLMSLLLGGMFISLWMLPWSEEETLKVHRAFMKTIAPKPIRLHKQTSHRTVS